MQPRPRAFRAECFALSLNGTNVNSPPTGRFFIARKDIMAKAQRHIDTLTPYQTSVTLEQLAREYQLTPESIVQLASNENPYGMSPKVEEALLSVAGHRYPEPLELREELARFYNVEPGNIVTGNGSNDILEMIARVYLGPNTEAIHTQYSYSVYAIATQSVGAKNIVVSSKDYNHDLAALKAAITNDTRVIWLTNPNNPTGTFTPYDDIKKFIAGLSQDIIVVLDEAYYEYVPHELREDSVRWLKEFPNLIIARTFSKAYGLAGIRAGYAIASPQIAELLDRVRSPFNTNSLALAAAIAALRDQAFIQESYEKNLIEKEYLIQNFLELGISWIPAYGNFITIELPNAEETVEQLMQKGIIVRSLTGYGLPKHVRVTIGKHEENTKLITAIQRQ